MTIEHRTTPNPPVVKHYRHDMAAKSTPEALQAFKRKENYIRKGLICAGVMVLIYVYSQSLLAQQASQKRISISQAVDFPNDI